MGGEELRDLLVHDELRFRQEEQEEQTAQRGLRQPLMTLDRCSLQSGMHRLPYARLNLRHCKGDPPLPLLEPSLCECSMVACPVSVCLAWRGFAYLTVLHLEALEMDTLCLDQCPSLEILKALRNPCLQSLSVEGTPQLRIVDLRNNAITALPRLPGSVRELELAENRLTSLSSDYMRGMSRLEILALQGNKDLRELPATLWDLPLVTLDLSGTGIHSLSSRISRLKRLRKLDLSGIPASFAALPILEIAVTGTLLVLMHAGPPHPSLSGRGWWETVRELPASHVWHQPSLENLELRLALREDGLLRGNWNPRVHLLYGRPKQKEIEMLWLLARCGPDWHPLKSIPREILIRISAWITAAPEPRKK